MQTLIFDTTLIMIVLVIPTYKEPLKGWTDNLYGPIGLSIGIATGVIRAIQADLNVPCEFVPADYVINAMIASAYKRGSNRCVNYAKKSCNFFAFF